MYNGFVCWTRVLNKKPANMNSLDCICCSFLEKEKQKEREEEVNKLRDELNEVTASLDKLDLEVKKFTASMQQMEEEIANQNRANSEKEDGYKVKKKTLDLLGDAENNIGKLQVWTFVKIDFQNSNLWLYCNSIFAPSEYKNNAKNEFIPLCMFTAKL